MRLKLTTSPMAAAFHLPADHVVGVILCTLGFTVWNTLGKGRISLPPVFFFLGFSLLCVYAGSLACSICKLPTRDSSFSLAFTLGFFLLGIALLVLAFALPFGLVVDAAILAAIVLAGRAFFGRSPVGVLNKPKRRVEMVVVVLCVTASGLWTQDCLRPMVREPETVLLKPWVDTQWESCQIRIFADSHGAASLQDLRMSGVRPAFYHYGAFLAPALLNAATGYSDYLACTTFMIPTGFLLSGLAAYVLGKKLAGPWGGFAAAFAIMALPDARWHGLGMPYFSYDWLQQIAPGGAYATALLAIAWFFVYEACQKRRPGLLLWAWILGVSAIHYKAQIAMATAPVLWLFPPLVYQGIPRRAQVTWFIAATLVLAAFFMLYAHISVGPTFRLDFSSVAQQIDLLHWQPESPWRKPFVLWLLSRTSFPGMLAGETLVVLLGTFGVLLAFYPAMVWCRSRNISVPWVLFPATVALNYLLLAVGLAWDVGGQGGPDEMLHRPFVWAYFVMLAWSAAIAGKRAARWLRSRPSAAGIALALALTVAAVIPLWLGRGAQSGPDWGKAYSRIRVPRGLLDSAAYVQSISGKYDLVQDSQNDPYFRLCSFAERQAYAIDHPAGKPPVGLDARLAKLRAFRQLENAADIREFAADTGIVWYVLDPGDQVRWPPEITDHPAFTSGGFRVYKLR